MRTLEEYQNIMINTYINYNIVNNIILSSESFTMALLELVYSDYLFDDFEYILNIRSYCDKFIVDINALINYDVLPDDYTLSFDDILTDFGLIRNIHYKHQYHTIMLTPAGFKMALSVCHPFEGQKINPHIYYRFYQILENIDTIYANNFT